MLNVNPLHIYTNNVRINVPWSKRRYQGNHIIMSVVMSGYYNNDHTRPSGVAYLNINQSNGT